MRELAENLWRAQDQDIQLRLLRKIREGAISLALRKPKHLCSEVNTASQTPELYLHHSEDGFRSIRNQKLLKYGSFSKIVLHLKHPVIKQA